MPGYGHFLTQLFFTAFHFFDRFTEAACAAWGGHLTVLEDSTEAHTLAKIVRPKGDDKYVEAKVCCRDYIVVAI